MGEIIPKNALVVGSHGSYLWDTNLLNSPP